MCLIALDLLWLQINKNKPEQQCKCRWYWLVAYVAKELSRIPRKQLILQTLHFKWMPGVMTNTV